MIIKIFPLPTKPEIKRDKDSRVFQKGGGRIVALKIFFQRASSTKISIWKTTIFFSSPTHFLFFLSQDCFALFFILIISQACFFFNWCNPIRNKKRKPVTWILKEVIVEGGRGVKKKDCKSSNRNAFSFSLRHRRQLHYEGRGKRKKIVFKSSVFKISMPPRTLGAMNFTRRFRKLWPVSLIFGKC